MDFFFLYGRLHQQRLIWCASNQQLNKQCRQGKDFKCRRLELRSSKREVREVRRFTSNIVLFETNCTDVSMALSFTSCTPASIYWYQSSISIYGQAFIEWPCYWQTKCVWTQNCWVDGLLSIWSILFEFEAFYAFYSDLQKFNLLAHWFSTKEQWQWMDWHLRWHYSAYRFS